jgi:hypothetical protein
MRIAAALLALPGFVLFLILCSFLFKRGGKRRRRFYSSTYALGLGLQMIQTFVAPNTESFISEELKDEAENEDKGGSVDPAKHLEYQLRRIRRGEQIDVLTTTLRDDD